MASSQREGLALEWMAGDSPDPTVLRALAIELGRIAARRAVKAAMTQERSISDQNLKELPQERR
jgi:hypothetical protein